MKFLAIRGNLQPWTKALMLVMSVCVGLYFLRDLLGMYVESYGCVAAMGRGFGDFGSRFDDSTAAGKH
eukprot:COSAG02_NODE_60564_length_271_cov_0.593023_1_plen_67_part_10